MSAETPSATPAAQPLREDIIESAVRFLTDPKVQSSTLAKKISFLETKGLTNAEIEDALARAKNSSPSTAAAAATTTTTETSQQKQQQQDVAAPAPVYGYAQQMAPPPPVRPHLDWKDYFIAAVVAGGLGYGVYILAKKFIAPLLAARDDKERLEQEKEMLLEQNELTRKQLESLNETTTRALDAMASQSQKTSEAIEGMTAILDKISEQEDERNASVLRLQLSLNDLQREIAALASKSAGSGDASAIADVQSDIRSLRSLLLSRRVPAYGSSPVNRPTTPTASSVSATAASPTQNADAPAQDSSSELATTNTATAAATSTVAAAAVSAASPLSVSSVPTPSIPAWQLGLMNGDASSASTDKGKEAA
ncbi:peroxisomal membrane protein pex14 [Dipsacomyces acuminosporus]|nr:peroxisomal membrane protein pex14 [Dipsacomyces acuminosporus]